MQKMNGSGGASVTISGIRKWYGRNEVLKGIDIDVPAGSFTTFLGPSGSGKTTTLAITTGLVPPDAGTVAIGGVECTKTPVNKRDLGFVFQSYALFPHMTVEKNVAFPLTLRKVPKAEIKRRVGEALELVRLDGLGKRYPAQLSGGQQQRVALARAVVFHPRVLLMDEPLGALDAGLRAHLQREIVRIGRELGVTILYVTHDQDEALSMSDQIILFSEGQVEQASSPQDLYCRPETVFAARFVGAGSVIEGLLERADGGWGVRTARGLALASGDAASSASLTAGEGAAVVVRSESVELQVRGSGQEPASCRRFADGVVTDVIYTGAHLRVHVDVGSTDVIEYRCSDLHDHWAPGVDVTVYLREDRPPHVVRMAEVATQAPNPAASSERLPLLAPALATNAHQAIANGDN
jgi:ABC-type Fe3+/spermidine/putrescine transport system ATPase subunit